MEISHENLLQKKIKEIRFKAIASIVCGFLGIIPYIGALFSLASWILFFIVLYDLKIYGGAKNLFKNLFIAVGIGFFGILINVSILFTMLKPRIGIFGDFYFNQDNIFIVTAVFLVLHFVISALIFPFLKSFYYEIARVTKQKYFINAFWAYFIGLCTLVIGIGSIVLIVGLIFWILAWVKFKELDKQEFSNLEERLAKVQKKVFDFDLKWIKILMISSLLVQLVTLLPSDFFRAIIYEFTISFNFANHQESTTYTYYTFLISTLNSAIILALLSVFLFCKKLKTYKLFVYFLLWQGLSVFGNYLLFISASTINDISIAHRSLMIALNLCCIILAFLFFKTLVQITKEKLFYLVFAFFACIRILGTLHLFIFMMVDYYIFIQSPINTLINNYISFFAIAYFISFLIVWLMLKGQKSVKKLLK